MRLKIGKSLATAFCLTVLFSVLPTNGWTAIAIKAEVVSGTIVQIGPNNTLLLNNGQTYYSSRDGLPPELQAGQVVTLRYYVEGGEKNVFFEYAPGANALNHAWPAPSKKETGPK